MVTSTKNKLFVIYYDERARSDDEHYMYEEHGVFGSVESAMAKINEIAGEEIEYLLDNLQTNKGNPLFPRLDPTIEVPFINELMK